MEKTVREKIALVVFAFGVVGALVAGVAYMIIGHSWNVAATHIDVTIDALDGFDVVVYEGVSRRYFDDAQPTSLSQQKAANAARAACNSVTAKYRDKGASVLQLDAVNPERYREGRVLLRDGVRYGVVSVAEDESKEQMQEKIDSLRSLQVHLVVVITPYKQTLNRVTGVDVAICRNDPFSQYSDGKYVGESFFVAPPRRDGSVGAVLVSSSGVAVAKSFYAGDGIKDSVDEILAQATRDSASYEDAVAGKAA